MAVSVFANVFRTRGNNTRTHGNGCPMARFRKTQSFSELNTQGNDLATKYALSWNTIL